MSAEQLQTVVALLRSRTLLAPSVEETRTIFEDFYRPFADAGDARCERVRAGAADAEWIVAPGADEDRVILYLHGGGFIFCSVATHRGMLARLSRAAKCRVLALEYRRAPEHPFPAQLEDSLAAYRWLSNEGVNPSRIVVAGDSAGGGMTVTTMVALRDANEPLPAAGVCISPWVDMEGIGESMKARAHLDPMLPSDAIQKIVPLYLGDSDRRAPLAAAIYADLRGLPPLYVQVGTAEVLFDDATRLVEHARNAGVHVIFEPWEGMVHVWHLFAPILDEGEEAIEAIGRFVLERTT